MSSSDQDHIAVVGAGLMGCGIAQVFLAAGHSVSLYDPYPEALAKAAPNIRANLQSIGGSQACLARLTLCEHVGDAVGQAAFVFEAGPEKLELKQRIFAQLDAAAPAAAVLASNTSVIPITDIASKLPPGRQAHVVGTHWWNPPYLVPLVEVVRTVQLSDTAFDRTMALLRKVGKKPVEVKKDVPGFVGNRLQHALWREAFAIVHAGICDAQTVDDVVKNSFGMRLPVLGPLENAELVGLDLTLDIHKVVLPHLDASGGPSPLLDSLVSSGLLGVKTGEGLRRWSEDDAQAVRRRVATHLQRMLFERGAET